jgi:hypothetical protein
MSTEDRPRIEVIHTAKNDPSYNLPYAPAIVVNSGRLLFTAAMAAPTYHHHPHRPEEFDHRAAQRDPGRGRRDAERRGVPDPLYQGCRRQPRRHQPGAERVFRRAPPLELHGGGGPSRDRPPAQVRDERDRRGPRVRYTGLYAAPIAGVFVRPLGVSWSATGTGGAPRRLRTQPDVRTSRWAPGTREANRRPPEAPVRTSR